MIRMELASATGKGRKITEFTMANSAAFAAMHTANVSSTVSANPLSRHSDRTPYFKSCQNASMFAPPLAAKTRAKIISLGLPASVGARYIVPFLAVAIHQRLATVRIQHAQSSQLARQQGALFDSLDLWVGWRRNPGRRNIWLLEISVEEAAQAICRHRQLAASVHLKNSKHTQRSHQDMALQQRSIIAEEKVIRSPNRNQ